MQKTITLSANSTRVEKFKGKVVACISATAEFTIELGKESAQSLSAGRKVTGAPFTRVRFTETSGSDNTIVVYIGDDDITLQQVISSTTSSTAISNDIASCVLTSSTQFVKTSSSPGTPVRLKNILTYARRAIIIAAPSLNGLAGSANAGNVALGPSSVLGEQPILLAPGDQFILEVPDGAKFNLMSWYLDVANSGDGVNVIYF